MTVFEYPQAHPNTTSSEITKSMNKKTPVVVGALSRSHTTDRIVKSGIRNGIPTYRINDMPSGYGGSLTVMFNQLLSRARQGTAQ